jgi:tRNA pseudouridine38-40 synthase
VPGKFFRKYWKTVLINKKPKPDKCWSNWADLNEIDRVYLPNCLLPEDQTLPQGIKRIAAAVEYNGRAFCGWQRQSHSPSVQQAVERALSFVADHNITVVCAGRTDTGVHATNQIIHFDTGAERQPHNWIRGANSRLPEGVRLHWLSEIEGHFHARFSALSRTYRYIICNEPEPPALFRGLVTWCRADLDHEVMHNAAQALLGEQDFSSFRAAGCQSRTPFRFVERIQVQRQGPLVVVEITANAFLHHMVRNIVGTLMAVGRHHRTPEWPGQLLALRDRTRAEPTAPADGLYLVSVHYPSRFMLPRLTPGPYLVKGNY